MKTKIAILLAVLALSVFLLGCGQQSSNYQSYNQPQGQQGQYVGGGCGVAPAADYERTPITEASSAQEIGL
ncbi:hypothetical protein HYS31_06210 [Candidatus Woesearchaeota archaeon]|nr:hypothetical protein [Candidatus Woesearchaeota archaeon]